MSVLSWLILRKRFELIVEKTIRYIRVSVERGSTVITAFIFIKVLSIGIIRFNTQLGSPIMLYLLMSVRGHETSRLSK